MVGRDGISHKKVPNKTNTMKHVSVVMTVVTRYGRKDGISHEKLPNKTNTMKNVSVVMTVVTRYGRKGWNQP